MLEDRYVTLLFNVVAEVWHHDALICFPCYYILRKGWNCCPMRSCRILIVDLYKQDLSIAPSPKYDGRFFQNGYVSTAPRRRHLCKGLLQWDPHPHSPAWTVCHLPSSSPCSSPGMVAERSRNSLQRRKRKGFRTSEKKWDKHSCWPIAFVNSFYKHLWKLQHVRHCSNLWGRVMGKQKNTPVSALIDKASNLVAVKCLEWMDA